MPDYKNFETEDFIQDDFFIAWVLHPGEAENRFWQQWLSDFPGRKIYTDQARTILLAVRAEPLHPPVTDAEVEDVLTFIKQHAGQPEPRQKPKLIYLRWLSVAAMLLVALSAALYLSSQKTGKQEQASLQWIKLKNQSGQSRLIRMADGSLAILKPGSVLKYPKIFSDTSRDVFLEGEAFFEVHKDPAKAFLVHSRDMVTRVLGTSFTVRAFGEEDIFKVVVNTGRVMVYTPRIKDSLQRSVLVLPHQQVTLKRQQSELVKDTVKVTMLLARETAKKEFSFYKAAIPEVIQKLEMAYNVKITYDSRQFENVTVTAALSDLPLDEKVKLLCKAVNAEYSFTDGKITIGRK